MTKCIIKDGPKFKDFGSTNFEILEDKIIVTRVVGSKLYYIEQKLNMMLTQFDRITKMDDELFKTIAVTQLG